ncbi:MAG: LysE family transporter [Syntrophomonadaceae bacterium]|nr:LysE family transporter [Syntrophomonadaceae bacterium]
MSLVQLAITSFLIAFSGALAPGPLMAITMRHGARLGAAAGLVVAIGHGLVETAMLWALATGLGKILILPQAASTIAILGAAVLAWMAWGALGEARTGASSWGIAPAGSLVETGAGPAMVLEQGTKAKTGVSPLTWFFPVLLAGVAATATNPYWMLWWATIGANYVLLAQTHGLYGLGSFFAGHLLADIVCFILFAAIAFTGHRFLGERFYRGLMLVLSVFLTGLAVYFARLALLA